MFFETHFLLTEGSKDASVNMGLASPQVTRGIPLPGLCGAWGSRKNLEAADSLDPHPEVPEPELVSVLPVFRQARCFCHFVMGQLQSTRCSAGRAGSGV